MMINLEQVENISSYSVGTILDVIIRVETAYMTAVTNMFSELSERLGCEIPFIECVGFCSGGNGLCDASGRKLVLGGVPMHDILVENIEKTLRRGGMFAFLVSDDPSVQSHAVFGLPIVVAFKIGGVLVRVQCCAR